MYDVSGASATHDESKHWQLEPVFSRLSPHLSSEEGIEGGGERGRKGGESEWEGGYARAIGGSSRADGKRWGGRYGGREQQGATARVRGERSEEGMGRGREGVESEWAGWSKQHRTWAQTRGEGLLKRKIRAVLPDCVWVVRLLYISWKTEGT